MKFAILTLLIFLSACQRNRSENSESLKLNFQEGDLTSLHPHDLMTHLREISIGKALFECLTRIDEKGNPKLAGAKSVAVSLDGLIYLFKLRENHWSDGSPVTAHQYEEAWNEALSPTSHCKRADLLYIIKSAIATDDQTLLVELNRPSSHFLELIAQPIAAPMKDRNEISPFNGPFIVDRWERGSLLTLKPNPYFWNRKQVFLPQIDVYMVQDAETAYALFEQKKLDWIGVPLCPLSSDQIDHLKEKKSLCTHPIDRAFWMFLNTQNQALSSPNIRKALSLAINRATITQNVFIGGDPLDKPLPHALLPTTAHMPKEDLVKAQSHFEMGLKELGFSKEDFPPLIISYSHQANRKQLAEYLQQTWSQAFGIEVLLEPQEWNVLRSNLGTGQFQISGCFEASYCHDPLELMERMITLNSSNFSQWIFPRYQQKIAAARKETNLNQRLTLLEEAEEILIDQMPFIPISSDRFLFAHHPKLKNFTFDSVGAVDFSYASIE